MRVRPAWIPVFWHAEAVVRAAVTVFVVHRFLHYRASLEFLPAAKLWNGYVDERISPLLMQWRFRDHNV